MTPPEQTAFTVSGRDGLAISVRAYGDGRPVVLLHGATLDAAWNWERPGIAKAIVDAGHRAILADLRGHGASGRPLHAEGFAFDLFVDDVRLVLDVVGGASAAIVGYSLGSVIALQAAARDARITRVVAGGLALEIVDPEPLPAERQAYADQLAADSEDDVTDERARQVREWDRSQGLDPKARAALIAGLRLPRKVDFDAVGVPCLVVNGDEDLAPDSLVARLPDARAAIVKGDHSSALDNPALAALIVEFLGQV